MESVAVDSSIISRIGYDPKSRHLKVWMRGGPVLDVIPCAAEEYAELMAAPSKGIHWYRVFAGRAIQAAEGERIKLQEPVPAPGPLDTWTPDECCGKHIARAVQAGKIANQQEFYCPACNCRWAARQVGPVRHWEPQTDVLVFRSR